MTEEEKNDSLFGIRLTAYNVKTKEKGVPMYNVIIDKVVNGKRITYVAKGTTIDNSTKLNSIVSSVKADEAINSGVASRGKGWN